MQQRHWIYVLSLALSVCVWTGCDNGETTNPVDTSSADMTMDVSGDGTTGDAGDTGGGDGTTTCDPECGANQSCVDGACACDEGFEDCDLEASNGCEVELGTESDCLSCGDTCAVAQNVTGLVCTSTGCDWTDCVAGFDDCDANKRNGCEVELATDVDHCGACDAACNFTASTGTCESGRCVITACEDGSFDIDENPDTGCELTVTQGPDLTRQNLAFIEGSDQLGFRGGDPFDLVYDRDDGQGDKLGYHRGTTTTELISGPGGSEFVVDGRFGTDIHVTRALGAYEPLAIVTDFQQFSVVDLSQSSPMEVSASGNPINDLVLTGEHFRVKSLGLPPSVRNAQMIVVSASDFNGDGFLAWHQIAKSGDPEYNSSNCFDDPTNTFQVCKIGRARYVDPSDSVEKDSPLPAIQDLDILPLFDAAGTNWRPLVIAAGAGEVVFAEPDFDNSKLLDITASVSPKDTATTNSIPIDIIDVVAIPGDDTVPPGFALVTTDAIKVYRLTQSAPGARPSQFELSDNIAVPSTILELKDVEAVDSTKLLASGNGAPNSILLVITQESSQNARMERLADSGTAYGELEYDPSTGQLVVFQPDPNVRIIQTWSLEFTEP